MKPVIVSILLVFSSIINVFAQPYGEFAATGTTWTYATHDDGPGYRYPLHMTSKGGTTYDGKLCKILVLDNNPQDTIYAYRDSLKMYAHSTKPNTKWQLICDFEKNVGDAQMIAGGRMGGVFYGDSASFIVTRKGDTIINGRTLPFLVFSNRYTAILNIGFVGTPLLMMTGAFVLEYGISFRCYEDTANGWSFKNPGVGNCNTLHTSSINNVTQSALIISPNPVADYLTIQQTTGKKAQLLLSDITGKAIATYHLPATATSTRIDARSLPQGMYICRLVVDGEILAITKLQRE
mgnify:CR=1 FL=1